MFFAHSLEGRPQEEWHSLRAHLVSTAERAAIFGKVGGFGNAAALAGLLHDLGKYTPEFQERLNGSSVRVDHSTAGAAVVRSLTPSGDNKFAGELIAHAIAGHHAGLPDRRGSDAALEERIGNWSGKLDEIWRSEVQPDLSGLFPTLSLDKEKTAFQIAFLGRMIFSCLVDADYKDTEAFYNAALGRQSDRDWTDLSQLLPAFIAAIERAIAGLNSVGPVNRLRADILQSVRQKASEAQGLFTLTVPTGGGKTYSSLAFALDHAREHGLRRIIYVAPFTTIIDQTAAIYRDLFGAENVLEHHSAIEEEFSPGRARESRDKLKLAMEDWAAPIVLTTNVQFFESLFASRPSRCRKLHNIAGSVIILDEAQTLPRHLLAPSMAAIGELARNYGCSIILCTATQPALEERRFQKVRGRQTGLALEGRELAPNPFALAKALKRVEIRLAGDMPDAELVAELGPHSQGLVIVNSRKHALDLYNAAVMTGLKGVVHLTTRQYGAHRMRILEDVRKRLKDGTSCRLIATSLVEAGVDLDFPRVWRASAGLDQIAQAAGRCNREGRRPVQESIVTVFTAPDHPPPSEILGLSGDMSRMYADHKDDLLSPAAIEAYFGEVYWRLGDRLDRDDILGRFRMDRTGSDFAYRTAAEQFRMIESGMVPVIVAREKRAREITSWIDIDSIASGRIARELQKFIVQVPPRARDLLVGHGHVQFRNCELRGEQFAVLAAEELYADDTGLIWEDPGYLAVEKLIW